MRVGTATSKLIMVRGNSGSGKSSVAAGLRAHYGRGLAVVGQDNIRRVILRERDEAGATNVGLIDLTVRYALDHGFDVVLEGILYSKHYADMLLALCSDHAGQTLPYYLDISFEETLKRHATKPDASDFGETEMREWYQNRDLLPGAIETVIGENSTLRDTVDRIIADGAIDAGHGEIRAATSVLKPRAVYIAGLPKIVGAAEMLYTDSDGRVLLVRAHYRADAMWGMPGGGLEHNEPPRAAAQREVGEEIGFDTKPGALLAVDWLHATDRPPLVVFTYFGGVLDERQITEIRLIDGEIVEYGFFHIHDAVALLAARNHGRLGYALEALASGATVELENGCRPA